MAPWVPFWKYLGFGLYVALYMVVCQELWDYPPETYQSAIFKVLPLMQLVFTLMTTHLRDDGYKSYRMRIIYGLVASMAGDWLLVWRVSMFLPGLGCFLLAHLAYINAFKLRPFGNLQTLVSVGIVGLLVGSVILPSIDEGSVMVAMVALYSSVIFVMVWRATVSFLEWKTLGTFCAFVGAWAFAASDTMIAYDKWVSKMDAAAFHIHATYFLAQLLIANSAACFEARQQHKRD